MRKVLYILSALSDSDIDWMTRHGRKQDLRKGTVLIEEGKPIETIFITLDGLFSVSLSAASGKETATLHAGEILGELSFLDSRPPSATIKAETDVSVLSIPKRLLVEKLEEDLGFAARLYRAIGIFLASRLRRSEQRLGEGNPNILDEESEFEGELAPDVLEHVTLAGARFEWMLKRLRTEPANQPGPES
jgi:CRP-like cAMP-binding protein